MSKLLKCLLTAVALSAAVFCSTACHAAGPGKTDLTSKAGMNYSVPIVIEDKIKSVECTELDIGEPRNIFKKPAPGLNTLIRTPSINPMYVRVEFTEPISFEAMRLRVVDTQHTWTFAVANTIEDLRAKRGSYAVILKNEVSRRGDIEVIFDKKITAKAMGIEITRQGGDDYVHIWQWQLCMPGRLDKKMTLQRVVNRREPDKPKAIEGDTIEVMAGTVVILKAQGYARGQNADISDRIVWRTVGNGIEPWGARPGMFLVKQPGKYTITARCADTFEESVSVVAIPRPPLKNRAADIDVWYIERLPRLDYPGADNKDPEAGWPAKGSTVTWRAHVYNWDTIPMPVRYRWLLDGRVVDTGKAVIPVGPPSHDATFIDLPWRWERVRHNLTFEVASVNKIRELVITNNALTIQTDAITVGFWVEQGLWEYYHEYQHRLPMPNKANSFADWAQRMIREWNTMFDAAVYPEISPKGITERVRLDRLVIVPEFALPLAGGLPSNNPDLRDKTVDIMWGFEAEGRPVTTLPNDDYWSWQKVVRAWEAGRIQNHKEDPPFSIGRGYMHEMCHARYLVDGYGFNVHTGRGPDIAKHGIRITDENGPILGRYWPSDIDIVHSSKYPGIMSSAYWYFSPYDAMCYERVRGWRARGGNCNGPPNIGEFLNDFPAQMVYQYKDQNGRPLAGAGVWVYQAKGDGMSWYGKVFEDAPAIKTKTDSKGRVLFDRTLFSADGMVQHGYGWSEGVVIVRITFKGKHYFTFEECTGPNIAYNIGHKDRALFRRAITLRDTVEPDPKAWDPTTTWEPKDGPHPDRQK